MNKEIEEALRVGDDRKVEEYIKQLENEIKMYKDFKEIANMKMGDRNVIRAIKNYKTLDKVKDMLVDLRAELEDDEYNCYAKEVTKILNIIREDDI